VHAPLLAAVAGLLAPARFRSRPPTFAAVPYLETARRRGRRGAAPVADLYLPDDDDAVPGPRPSVVIVHGGAFVIGSRRMKGTRLLATRLCETGHAVCTLDYRLLFRGGGLREGLADVEAGVAWWRAAAAAGRYGLDPGRIALAGLSAGATLALLHAARARPGDVRRVVSIFGVYDFAALEGRLAAFLARSLFGTSDRAVWAAGSPAAPGLEVPVPLLLIHGTADGLVPWAQATRLAAQRAARGLATETLILPGAPHGFLNDATCAAAEQAVAAVRAFLA
jgi:acetyl esterase/lipase